MSDDSNIQVTFGAQIQGLLDGMGKAQDSVKEATEGMSGSIAKMAETMASLGPAALGLAAVGFAFEGIKKTVDYVIESTEATQALAKSFATLEYSTGASNQEMNQYVAAIQLSGGSTEDLTGLMQGMTRAVKQNADGLIMNGVAADKASLQNMNFGDYLAKVNEIANEMASPLQKNEFLMLALGRAGAKTGMLLDEFVKHAKEAKGVQIISPFAIEQMHQMEEAEGRLKNADEAYAAGVSAWASVMKMAWLNVKAAATEHANASNDAMELARRGFIQSGNAADDWRKNVILDMDLAIAKAKEWNAAYAEGLRTSKDSMDAGAHRAGEDKKREYVDPHAKDKPAAPAAAVADPRIAAAKDAYEKTKILLEQEVADGRMTEREKTEALMEAVQVREKAELAAAVQTAAQKLQVTRQSENEIAQLGVTETNQQNAEVAKWSANYLAKQKEVTEAAAAAAKLMGDLAKEASREQVAAGKDALAAQKATLDQKVSMGQISSAQELAQRKALIQAEEQLNLQAKDAEIADEKKGGDDPVKLQQLANQKVDIERKAQAQITELNRKAAQQQQQTYHQVFSSLTGGFSSAIAGLIRGTMSWGQALKSVMSSALDGIINFFVQWGLKQAETYLAGLIFGQTTNATEGASGAALAAVNAFASTAAIPLIGPELAPEAAAAAYGQAMSWAALASAAGGWDQVPGDQVAQIHKNEMVMSAPLATGIRNMVANGQAGAAGGQGGGGNSLHVQAMDAKSFGKWLNKSANQKALGGVLGGMMRNGARR